MKKTFGNHNRPKAFGKTIDNKKETFWKECDNIRDIVKHNKQLKCSNPLCKNRRWGRSKWCSRCLFKVTAYGNPNLKPISQKAYAKHIKRVKRLLSFNFGHPLVEDFIKRFNEICEAASQGINIEYGLYWKHIHEELERHKQGVYFNVRRKPFRNSLVILKELAGFYLLYEEDLGGIIIKTEEQRYHALASIVGFGSKVRIRPVPTAKKWNAFGRHVEELFRLHLIKIARGVQKQEREAKDRIEALEKMKF